MSNMVANRLTVEAENVREIIMSLLTFDELGDEADFDFNKVIKMPKTIKDSTKWARKNWGCKDNALYTSVDMDEGIIEFETPWSPCLPVIEKIAEMYPKATFTYEYSFEETGYNVGKYIYMYGRLIAVVEMEPYTKEAYEQHFDLWGKDEAYVYDEKLDNYVLKTKNLKVYELEDSDGNKIKLYPIIQTYRKGGRLAIELVDEHYELFTYLTVNLQHEMSKDNNKSLAFVDTNNNEWAERYIEKHNLGTKTGFFGLSGYCTYPEYRFDLSKLNEESK